MYYSHVDICKTYVQQSDGHIHINTYVLNPKHTQRAHANPNIVRQIITYVDYQKRRMGQCVQTSDKFSEDEELI